MIFFSFVCLFFFSLSKTHLVDFVDRPISSHSKNSLYLSLLFPSFHSPVARRASPRRPLDPRQKQNKKNPKKNVATEFVERARKKLDARSITIDDDENDDETRRRQRQQRRPPPPPPLRARGVAELFFFFFFALAHRGPRARASRPRDPPRGRRRRSRRRRGAHKEEEEEEEEEK